MRTRTYSALVIGVVLMVVVNSCGSTPEPTPTPKPSQNMELGRVDAVIDETASRLSLESLNCETDPETGYAFVSGLVRNTSSNQKFDDVLAVGSWFTKDRTFIASDEALLTFNPLMPGQSSPFKTYTTYNPMMEKCDVRFRSFMGEELKYRQAEPTAVVAATMPPYPDIVNQTEGAARTYRRIIETTSCHALNVAYEKYKSEAETDRYPALSLAFMDAAYSRFQLECPSTDATIEATK